MLKKISVIFICVCLAVATAGCNTNSTSSKNADGKLKVVATLFAQYDFTRQIAGEHADVTLLLPPGVESHTYEPSPADIIKIKNSDLFIYTGKYMENWASGIIDGLDTSKNAVLDVSGGITLVSTEEEHEEHDDDDGEHSGEHGHNHQFDPHIWTSPANAEIMAQNIANALSKADPANADAYAANAQKYISELKSLDNDFVQMISQSKHKKIMFGGRFAMYYFAKHYNLDYDSAYDSCSSETEPGAKLVAKIIDEIKSENIGAVYYEEMSNHAVADQIAAETGAQSLLLHSCHNVSKDELSNGETYISLMRKNLENLKKGLN